MRKILILLLFLFLLLPLNLAQAESLPSRLTGRILLQVQSHGEAWYVNPDSQKRFYLGRPADAFNVMRSLGLGITDVDLAKILIASVGVQPVPISGAAVDTPLSWNFKYENNSYQVNQNLSSLLFDAYRSSTKVYSYTGATVSDTVMREAFYGIFFNTKPEDFSLDDLVIKLNCDR